MKIKRRDFLKLSAATGVAAAAFKGSTLNALADAYRPGIGGEDLGVPGCEPPPDLSRALQERLGLLLLGVDEGGLGVGRHAGGRLLDRSLQAGRRSGESGGPGRAVCAGTRRPAWGGALSSGHSTR